MEYVGHPLVEHVNSDLAPEDARKSLELPSDALCIGLLPGSRKSEINHMLPVMLEAARLIHDTYPDAKFILPLADSLEEQDVYRWIERSSIPVKVVVSDFENGLRACSSAIVTSGTATLHTALLDIPMVIAYRVSPTSYFMGKLFIRVDFIGMVNLIAGRQIVPRAYSKKGQCGKSCKRMP